MRVYLAGPMTGIPLYNFPAFDAHKARWIADGQDVTLPADITRELWRERYEREYDPATDTAAWGDAIVCEMFKRDMAAVCDADAIALLPGWRKSKGANLELAVARALGKKVYDSATMLPLADESALEEAQRLVHGDRGASYGHPIDDYTRTGRMWGAILGIPDIDPRVCCLMMGAVKISREVNAPKRDNRVDLAGYAECAQMVAERQGVA